MCVSRVCVAPAMAANRLHGVAAGPASRLRPWGEPEVTAMSKKVTLVMTSLACGDGIDAARWTIRALSSVVGAVFAAAFAGIASGAGSVPVNLAFTTAVIISCGWLSVVAVDLYRGTRRAEAMGVAR